MKGETRKEKIYDFFEAKFITFYDHPMQMKSNPREAESERIEVITPASR